MRQFSLLTIFCLIGFYSIPFAQQNSQAGLFPKGEKAPANRFTGNVWVHNMVTEDEQLDCIVANVTFEPGARTYWHFHPGGQVLLVTEGEGWYQEKGSAVKKIQKGDVVKCPPGIEHWHGATPDSRLTHVALVTRASKGAAQWLHEVSINEYKGPK